MADCKYCSKKGGLFRSEHKECATVHRDGWQRMVSLAAQAVGAPDFSEAALRENLAAIARSCFVDDDGISAAIAEGWQQAVGLALADGIITQEEENRLRDFRDRFALQQRRDIGNAAAQMERASRDRLVLDARLAALATVDGDTRLKELAATLKESALLPVEQRDVLAQAWEAAVEGSLEDGPLTLEEENALVRYLHHFDLSQEDVDANGAYHNMVKSIVIREAAEGIIPNRLGDATNLPFNLMKSEQLVWVINDVDYYEIKTMRERRGTSHGLSVRVAKGLYYRPGTFRSRAVEWDETVHADSGVLGVTSKHIYFHGPKKRFRVRYDKIVSFEPYNDGIEIMRDAQTAKPQVFRTGDGWFIYNLVTNLAQHR